MYGWEGQAYFFFFQSGLSVAAIDLWKSIAYHYKYNVLFFVPV